MSYVLENLSEWERLEFQSTLPQYDYKKELKDFEVRQGSKILDAGCGSGVVTRYLAKLFPSAQIVGCDLASDRIQRSIQHSKEESSSDPSGMSANISFDVQDLSSLSYPSLSFDGIVCRYVLQHLSEEKRAQVLSGFHRCLKPGGYLHLIDYDGPFHNLFPQPPLVEEVLKKLELNPNLDLQIGRKLPALAIDAGFSKLKWRMELVEFQGESLAQETELLKTRLDYAQPFLTGLLGDSNKAQAFKKEFINALSDPRAVYFYNKVIVSAQRPQKTRETKLYRLK